MITSFAGCEATPPSDPYFEVALSELASPLADHSAAVFVETFGNAARAEVVRKHGFLADSSSIGIPPCTADYSCRFNWHEVQIDTVLRPRDDGDWAVSFSTFVYLEGLDPATAVMGTRSGTLGDLVLRHMHGEWKVVGTANLLAVN